MLFTFLCWLFFSNETFGTKGLLGIFWLYRNQGRISWYLEIPPGIEAPEVRCLGPTKVFIHAKGRGVAMQEENGSRFFSPIGKSTGVTNQILAKIQEGIAVHTIRSCTWTCCIRSL